MEPRGVLQTVTSGVENDTSPSAQAVACVCHNVRVDFAGELRTFCLDGASGRAAHGSLHESRDRPARLLSNQSIEQDDVGVGLRHGGVDKRFGRHFGQLPYASVFMPGLPRSLGGRHDDHNYVG